MITVENDRNLRDFNTFGLDVKCSRFIEYTSEGELELLVSDALKQPLFHIGRGSNLLFTKDFQGTILHSTISFINILSKEKDTCSIEVGAGLLFDDFCAWAASNNLWGVENLSLIPGEVGAAAVQNIGAYGSEIKDVIQSVRCFDTIDKVFIEKSCADCNYGYRDSFFKGPENRGRYIITSVVILLRRDYYPQLGYRALAERVVDNDDLTPEIVRNTVIKIRNEKLPDPKVVGSAGSFFKNPVVPLSQYNELVNKYGTVPHYDMPNGMIKIPAAFLIEQSGWKGYKEGNAAVWEKQPLVLVNLTGKASASEILDLENKIITSVYEKFSIELKPEVDHI